MLNPANHPVTVLDRVFWQGLYAVARWAGLRVRIAESAADRAAAAAVREAVSGSPQIPAELAHIHRRYEAQAVVLVVFDGDRAVGTLRLFVPDASGSRTLDSGPLELPSGVGLGEVFDIGQLAVLPDYRGGARLTFLLLLARAQQLSEAMGRPYWVGMTHPRLVEVFRRINPTITVLPLSERDDRPAEMRNYWGAYRAKGASSREPFLLVCMGGAPSVVLTQHLRQLALWFLLPMTPTP